MSSWKRKRSTKAKMSGRIIITAIDEEGAPSAPTYARTKFVNQVGYIVRENIPISFKAWKEAKDLEPADVVPEQEKQLCWEQLMSHFTLPAGQGIEESEAVCLQEDDDCFPNIQEEPEERLHQERDDT